MSAVVRMAQARSRSVRRAAVEEREQTWWSANRGRILLATLLTAAAAFAWYWNRETNPVLAATNGYVCVSTGEVFVLSTDKTRLLPEENPRTKERTLLPCLQRPDGEVEVVARYRTYLEGLKDQNRVVDVGTLMVRRTGE